MVADGIQRFEEPDHWKDRGAVCLQERLEPGAHAVRRLTQSSERVFLFTSVLPSAVAREGL